MTKRFSMKEMALLTAPVLAIGALGLWVSRRPKVDDGKAHLTFRISKPTALQAFKGSDAVLKVSIQSAKGNSYWPQENSRWFEARTPKGLEDSRRKTEGTVPWKKVFNGGINNDTLLIRSQFLPLGEVYFSYQCVAVSMPLPVAGQPGANLLRLSGRWKIDRTQIQPLNLASWPRKPLVSVREVKIARIESFGNRRFVVGQVTFQFEGAKMTDETPLEIQFASPDASAGTRYRSQSSKPRKNSRQRITEWDVDSLNTPNPMVRITGRASADNRWPLGFEIEPFNFKTAKVGQKLKFKQFPVALPKP